MKFTNIPEIDSEKLKYIGGGIVIAAAACIMLDQISSFVAGLLRVGILIGLTLLICVFLVHAVRRISKLAAGKSAVDPTGKPDQP